MCIVEVGRNGVEHEGALQGGRHLPAGLAGGQLRKFSRITFDRLSITVFRAHRAREFFSVGRLITAETDLIYKLASRYKRALSYPGGSWVKRYCAALPYGSIQGQEG